MPFINKCTIKVLVSALILLTMTVLSGKSVPKAMLLSAVLPGSGEIYAGKLSRGVAFITTDAVLLFSANRISNEVKWLQDSYKQFAYAKAGIPTDSDNSYYELLHEWYSSDIYNAEVELYYRNLGLAYYNNPDYYNDLINQYSIPDGEAWRWNSQADWNKYKSIRRDKQTQIMNRKLVIGAVIANRVISVLDAAFLVKIYNRKYHPTFSVIPDFINNGAILNCSLEF
jgi:hypothetical protein